MVPRIYSQKRTFKLGIILLCLFLYNFSFGQSPPVFSNDCPVNFEDPITLPAGDASVGGGSITFTSDNIPFLLGVFATDPDGTNITYTATPSSISCDDLNGFISQSFFITVTATDESGVSTNCLSIVEVFNGGPLAVCNTTFTDTLPADGSPLTISEADIDNGSSICDGNLIYTFDQSSFDCDDVGTFPVTMTVSSNSSFFTSSCVSMVTVVDTTAPQIITTCPADASIGTSAGSITGCSGSYNWTHPTFTDLCAVGTYSLSGATTTESTSFSSGGIGSEEFELGTTTVSYVVSDGNNPDQTCSFSVTVTDDEVPFISCNNFTVYLDPVTGLYSLTQDDRDSIASGTFDNCVTPNITMSPNSFNCTQLNTTVPVQVTVDDGTNAIQICTTAVMVKDTLVFDTIGTNFNTTLILDCNSTIPSGNGGITANSSCGSASLNFNETSTQGLNPNCPNNYMVTRTWIATDNNGNIETLTQNIFVVDNQEPTLTFGDTTIFVNADVNNNTACDAFVDNEYINLTASNVSDNCSDFADLTISYTRNGGGSMSGGNASGIYEGINTIVFTIEDQCGKITTRTVIVEIIDDVAPVALCQSNVTVGIPTGATSILITPDMIDNGSFDNCLGNNVDLFIPEPNIFTCDQLTNGVGQFVVTLGVGENQVNADTSYCVTTITIQDNSPPEAICQDITVALDANGIASVTPDMVNNGSFDGCSDIELVTFVNNGMFTNQIDYTVADIGSNNQVTLVIEDDNGNQDVCFANVTVVAPETCFEVASNIEVSSGIYEIPVTTTDFINLNGFQFAIALSDPSVATFVGVNNINPSLTVNGSITPPSINLTGDTLSVLWSSSTPLTLNSAELFTLSINVTGAIGTTADINFVPDALTPALITTNFGGNFFFNEPCLTNGSIEVNELAILTVAGNISTTAIGASPAEPVNNVIISKTETFLGTSTTVPGAATSDPSGNYSADVTNQSGGVNLDLTASKNTPNWSNNGDVNALDVGAIKQHIVLNNSFTSIFEYIAADLNEDGQIDIIDVIFFDDIILNPEISAEPSEYITTYAPWKFSPVSDNIASLPLPGQPNSPNPINEEMSFNNFTANVADADWVAIKMGQIVGPLNSQLLTNSTVETRSGKDFEMLVENQKVIEGELISIPVYGNNYTDFIGWQFTLEFDVNSLLFEGMEQGAVSNFNEGKLGLKGLENGTIGALWYGTADNIDEDEVLFTLNFRALEDAPALNGLITVNSKVVNALSGVQDGREGGVKLSFFESTSNPVNTQFELHQNRPNPFNGSSIISFVLPEAGKGKITVFDISGKVLKEFERDFVKGYNEITINSEELSATGVLYYQLESSENIATKKMIIID